MDTWQRTMANTMWLPCNWKVVLDNFNESYHVPTVHMGATPSTDRTAIAGGIAPTSKKPSLIWRMKAKTHTKRA